MRISFSGTRRGCSGFQLKMLKEWLLAHRGEVTLAAHGGCIGADIQFHLLVRRLYGSGFFIAVYPSDAQTRAPLSQYQDANFIDNVAKPLIRNEKIIIVGHGTLLACPRTDFEVQRSGTWHAIRCARSNGVPVVQFLRKES